MRQNLRLQPYQTVIDLNRYFSERHTMNQTVINYHKQRRPFIIIPETGLFSEKPGSLSPTEKFFPAAVWTTNRSNMFWRIIPAVIFLTTNWSSISGRMLKKVPAGN